MRRADLTPWYLAAVLGTLAVVVGSLTALKIARVEIDQLFIGLITATVLPTLTALLAALRSEANGRQLDQVQQAAADAAEKAEVAKRVAIASHQDLIVNSTMTQQIRDKVVPP